MKRVLAMILLSPFLVCNPNVGITSYWISGLGDNQTVEAQLDGSIRIDLADIEPGSYELHIKACAEHWGCFDPAPFYFTRPYPSTPKNIHLSK